MRKSVLLLVGLFWLCEIWASLAMADPLGVQLANGKIHRFNVRIANNDQTREKGLMGVQNLPEDQGMLFVFDDLTPAQFWMKDTLIPLDMVFIDGMGVVSSVHSKARPLDFSVISSKEPVKAVLEISGGVAEKLGIDRGDQIISPIFGKSLDKP
ncbi:MAG: DUF192 domain-containing protein [Alphaproteobacteria bacterium]|jgi:uncharacterized membrane protein (UPF0127 family)|nr:DUF192 domain-containing protein [Alphaproteobacteria bacterium]